MACCIWGLSVAYQSFQECLGFCVAFGLGTIGLAVALGWVGHLEHLSILSDTDSSSWKYTLFVLPLGAFITVKSAPGAVLKVVPEALAGSGFLA